MMVVQAVCPETVQTKGQNSNTNTNTNTNMVEVQVVCPGTVQTKGQLELSSMGPVCNQLFCEVNYIQPTCTRVQNNKKKNKNKSLVTRIDTHPVFKFRFIS